MKLVLKIKIRLMEKSTQLREQALLWIPDSDELLDKMINKHLTPLEMEQTAKEFHKVRKKIFRNMRLAEVLSILAGRCDTGTWKFS